MPDVSCVVPTHGRDDLLTEAVASIAAQQLTPAELIVSDDLGSAATRALVEQWDQDLTFPVRYVDSSGTGWRTAGASRNAGAALATGDLMAFLDDDDVWEPEYLASLTAALDAGGCDFAVGWTEADVGGGVYHIARMRAGLRVADVVARNPGFVGSNFVMTRAAFAGLGGFDPALTVANDKDLLVRALQHGLRYAVVPAVLVRNRIHSGPQLTDKTERRVRGIETYMAKHSPLLSGQDRRYLRAQISSIRRVTASSRVARWRSTAALAYGRTTFRLLDAVKR